MEQKFIVKKKKVLSDKISTRPRMTKAEPVARLGMHNLPLPKGAHKRKKLLGRGPSSGHGKTSTRGSKGQTSRAGRHFYLGFEGGQSPLIRRFPKRGFTSIFKKEFQIVNLSSIAGLTDTAITPELLEKKGIIRDRNKRVKILGDGELSAAVTVTAHAFSKKAQDKIRAAGGSCEVLGV